jgi:hypothetical protein
MNDWLELLLHSDNAGGWASDPQRTLFVLLLAFVLGQIIGWTYMGTHRVLSYSQTFTASLVILPVLVALMMLLMSGSMVIAFGLLAVFAVVRFRNVLKDTRDTVFVLWGIVEGMAVGTLRYSTAIIAVVVIALILLYLRLTSFGARQRYDAVLNLVFQGDQALTVDLLVPILRRYSLRVHQASARRVDKDSWDVSYHLLLRDPRKSDQLQSELESTTPVQQVVLFMRDDESEV